MYNERNSLTFKHKITCSYNQSINQLEVEENHTYQLRSHTELINRSQSGIYESTIIDLLLDFELQKSLMNCSNPYLPLHY